MLETPQPTDVLSMILGSGPVVKSVLAILIFLSVWTWAIAISKYLQFRRILQDSEEFSSLFWEIRNFARIDDSAKRLVLSPLAKMFASGYREFIEMINLAKAGKQRSM
jgi:biopolymer transport protein TolQ